ncbi:MAG: PIG-L family deacetylase [Acidobacteriota bacterium]|nr:PIG-L family deacetylase [Acidobacteriota bacterium]
MRLLSFSLTIFALATPLGGGSPLEPPSTGGIVALHRALARLDVHKRLLIIGAHPDDEDTSLLALVSRGMGGEAAYLSLSRGEGGQNLIGTELGRDLGLVRSQELLSARGVDGGHQFFTRAFDFGYTRSLDETVGRWPEEVLLEDAVRVVRRFKPQIIVSVFPNSARAGHGQHQAAGLTAERVFEAAGDPAQFPEMAADGLAPWQPRSFYRSAFFRPVPGNLVLETGGTDPGSGKTYFQLAMASRSMHRSQDMGVLQDTGPRSTRVVRESSDSDDPDLFAGVDTHLAAIADLIEDREDRDASRARLQSAADRVAALRREVDPGNLGVATAALGALVSDLRAAHAQAGAATVAGQLLREKVEIAEEAWTIAAGLVLDATTTDDRLVAGRRTEIRVVVYNSGSAAVEVAPALDVPAGWSDPEGLDPQQVPAGESKTWTVELSVPASAEPTVPYFLAAPRQGDVYDWSGVAVDIKAEPFGPPPLSARFRLTAGGLELERSREVVQRFRDQAVGERRRPLRVVPVVEVAVDPARLVWPVGQASRRTVRVSLTKNVGEALDGTIEVSSPLGWPSVAAVDFSLEATRERRTYELVIERPADDSQGGGTFAFAAALSSGVESRAAYPLVDYPHIRAVPCPRPALADIQLLDLELPGAKRIAYIRGASDRVPESLLEVGLPIQLVTSDQLLDMDETELASFDSVVIGSRAYETDSRLAEANPRLREYVARGGTLLVQYQQYAFSRGGMALLPLSIARPHDRITDETAAMNVIAPDHGAFTSPNAIGKADWQGWVQERGLYFANEWDDSYKSLLRISDPGRDPQEGGLLVAPIGEGTYIYTGLAFFRQLPAGVPGAFRLFANLLNL